LLDSLLQEKIRKALSDCEPLEEKFA